MRARLQSSDETQPCQYAKNEVEVRIHGLPLHFFRMKEGSCEAIAALSFDRPCGDSFHDVFLKEDKQYNDRNDCYENRREDQLPWIAVLARGKLGEIELKGERFYALTVADYKEGEQVVIPDPHGV